MFKTQALHSSTFTSILLALLNRGLAFLLCSGPINYVASPDYVTRLSEGWTLI